MPEIATLVHLGEVLERRRKEEMGGGKAIASSSLLKATSAIQSTEKIITPGD